METGIAVGPASDVAQEKRRIELRDAFVQANPCTKRQDWDEELCNGCEFMSCCPRKNDEEFQDLWEVA